MDMDTGTPVRAFRFECVDPADGGRTPPGVHHTGDFSLAGWWAEMERPVITGMAWQNRVLDSCMAQHRLMLRVGGVWVPMADASSPGLAEDIEIGGRRLSTFEVPNSPGLRWLTGRCHHAWCYADLPVRAAVLGYVVRRTVEDGVELRPSLGHHWGYDVAVFGRPGDLRRAMAAAEPLQVDRNNWAVVDEMFACGHRSG
jgi:hypothetical protein